jgi:hypothetical protein
MFLNQREEQQTLKTEARELARIVMELLALFSRMQQHKLTESKFESIMLLRSPFTLSQTYQVIRLLLNLLNGPYASTAVVLLIDHMLAIRQSGSTLEEVTNNSLSPSNISPILLQAVIDHRPDQLNRLMSLMKEHVQYTKTGDEKVWASVIELTAELLKTVKLNDKVTKEMLIVHLLDLPLPLKPFESELAQEMKTYIKANFETRSNSTQFATALRFLTHFAVQASRSPDSKPSLQVIHELFEQALSA